MLSVKYIISVIRCYHLALSQLLHAAYFLSTEFEEAALEPYCHKDVRLALPAQRTTWQEAAMIANAEGNQEACVQRGVCPLTSSSLPSLGHSVGQGLPQANVDQSQHQSPMNFSNSFFFFFCTYFIYFCPPQQYLTMTSTILLCISFLKSSRVCSLGQ